MPLRDLLTNSMDIDFDDDEPSDADLPFDTLLKRLDRISESQNELARLMQKQLDAQRAEVEEVRRFLVDAQTKKLREQQRKIHKLKTLHRRSLSVLASSQATPQPEKMRDESATPIVTQKKPVERRETPSAQLHMDNSGYTTATSQLEDPAPVAAPPVVEAERSRSPPRGFTAVNAGQRAPVAPIAPMAPMARMATSASATPAATETPKPREHVTPVVSAPSTAASSTRPIQRAKCSIKRGKRGKASGGSSLPTRAEVAARTEDSEDTIPASTNSIKRKRPGNPPPSTPPFPGAPLNPLLFDFHTIEAHYGGELTGAILYQEGGKPAVLLDPRRHYPAPSNMLEPCSLVDVAGVEWIARHGLVEETDIPVFVLVPSKGRYLYCGEYNWGDWHKLDLAEYRALPEEVRESWIQHFIAHDDELVTQALRNVALRPSQTNRQKVLQKLEAPDSVKMSLRLSATRMLPENFMRPTYETLKELAAARREADVWLYDRPEEEQRLKKVTVGSAKKRLETMSATDGELHFPEAEDTPRGRVRRTGVGEAQYDIRELSRGSLGDMMMSEDEQEVEAPGKRSESRGRRLVRKRDLERVETSEEE